MRKLTHTLALAGSLLVAVGCSRNRAAADVNTDRPTMLRVDNQAFNDMTIYVLNGAQRVRLGTANGHSETMFTLPKYLVRSIAELRFQADPIGGNRTPVSQSITVNPGDEVVLRIPPA